MGAWGTALYSDDIARDVRDDFRELIRDGLSGEQATDRLLQEWNSELDDPDSGPVFWLALADTQWRCGRLEPRVKARAEAILADKSDLARWQDDPPLLRRREAVLDKLAEKLASPLPPPKKLQKRFRNHCDWKVGELIAYDLLSGQKIVFRVIGYHTDKGGTGPVCELLDWVGDQVPGKLRLAFVGVRKGGRISQFLLGRTSEKELPVERVTRLGISLPPTQRPGGYTGFPWRYLDMLLEKYFALK